MAEEAKTYLDQEGLAHYDKKLKADFTSKLSKKFDADKAATDSELGLVKIGDGLEVTEGEVGVKPKEDGAITVTQDGVDVDFSKGTKATGATLGLVTIGDGLEVTNGHVSAKPYTDGGIEVDSDGIGINLKDDGGIEVTEGEVGVKAKSNGGITVDSNGVSVNWQNAPAASAETAGMVKLGTGLKVGEDGSVEVDTEKVGTGQVNWSDISDKPDVVTKEDLVQVYQYTATVSTYDELPTGLEDTDKGHVYNVEDTGMNYAWAGIGAQNADEKGWDKLGGSFSIKSITNEDIDKLFEDE